MKDISRIRSKRVKKKNLKTPKQFIASLAETNSNEQTENMSYLYDVTTSSKKVLQCHPYVLDNIAYSPESIFTCGKKHFIYTIGGFTEATGYLRTKLTQSNISPYCFHTEQEYASFIHHVTEGSVHFSLIPGEHRKQAIDIIARWIAYERKFDMSEDDLAGIELLIHSKKIFPPEHIFIRAKIPVVVIELQAHEMLICRGDWLHWGCNGFNGESMSLAVNALTLNTFNPELIIERLQWMKKISQQKFINTLCEKNKNYQKIFTIQNFAEALNFSPHLFTCELVKYLLQAIDENKITTQVQGNPIQIIT
jgi:hypothetical protein